MASTFNKRHRLSRSGAPLTNEPQDEGNIALQYARARSSYDTVYITTGAVNPEAFVPIESTPAGGDSTEVLLLTPGFAPLVAGWNWAMSVKWTGSVFTVSAVDGSNQIANIRLEASQNLGPWLALETQDGTLNARAGIWGSQLGGNEGGNTLYCESVAVSGMRSFEGDPGFPSAAGNNIRLRAAWNSTWTLWSGSGVPGGLLPDENLVTGGWNLDAHWVQVFTGV